MSAKIPSLQAFVEWSETDFRVYDFAEIAAGKHRDRPTGGPGFCSYGACVARWAHLKHSDRVAELFALWIGYTDGKDDATKLASLAELSKVEGIDIEEVTP